MCVTWIINTQFWVTRYAHFIILIVIVLVVYFSVITNLICLIVRIIKISLYIKGFWRNFSCAVGFFKGCKSFLEIPILSIQASRNWGEIDAIAMCKIMDRCRIYMHYFIFLKTYCLLQSRFIFVLSAISKRVFVRWKKDLKIIKLLIIIHQ